jgi:hypothetical protein
LIERSPEPRSQHVDGDDRYPEELTMITPSHATTSDRRSESVHECIHYARPYLHLASERRIGEKASPVLEFVPPDRMHNSSFIGVGEQHNRYGGIAPCPYRPLL